MRFHRRGQLRTGTTCPEADQELNGFDTARHGTHGVEIWQARREQHVRPASRRPQPLMVSSRSGLRAGVLGARGQRERERQGACRLGRRRHALRRVPTSNRLLCPRRVSRSRHQPHARGQADGVAATSGSSPKPSRDRRDGSSSLPRSPGSARAPRRGSPASRRQRMPAEAPLDVANAGTEPGRMRAEPGPWIRITNAPGAGAARGIVRPSC